MATDEDYLSIHPFLGAIANVDVLAQVETVRELLQLHSRSNYIINYPPNLLISQRPTGAIIMSHLLQGYRCNIVAVIKHSAD